ncbi:hypothetical protein COV19_01540 [Candidatus Woesearchaeota archaeon CG10_big_fil_rev_8_21_14_0_10_44_13]|nr:MAG: hypothetical protein COV19_01540 [Candidatus Woesearchaeota archaeon CG10_big_fil_rev_8_21_14_0_10_44_13]
MHETAIANIVLNDLRKHKNVKAASIEVGELAEVTAAELEEALNALSKIKFEVSEKKAKVRCKCGYEGRPEILERGHHFSVFVCKECGEVPEIVEGNGIRIKDIEIKDYMRKVDVKNE